MQNLNNDRSKLLVPGTNTGVLIRTPETQDPRDYIAGAVTGIPFQSRIKTGDWRPFHPVGELQKYIYFDSMGCVSYSAGNSVEVQMKYFLSLDILDLDILYKELELWFDDNNEFNGSDRALAKLSGTTEVGNYMDRVANAMRFYGIVPQKAWPNKLPGKYTWNKYYADIPQHIVDLGLKWKKYFDVKWEWVIRDPKHITRHIQQAPLQIAHPICSPWHQNNQIIKNCGKTISEHATLMTAITPTYYADFDHYIPYDKKLAKDYHFGAIMKIVLTPLPAILKKTNNMITLYRAKNTGNTIYHLGIGSKKYHPIAHEKYALDLYGSWDKVIIKDLDYIGKDQTGKTIGEYDWLMNLLSNLIK